MEQALASYFAYKTRNHAGHTQRLLQLAFYPDEWIKQNKTRMLDHMKKIKTNEERHGEKYKDEYLGYAQEAAKEHPDEEVLDAHRYLAGTHVRKDLSLSGNRPMIAGTRYVQQTVGRFGGEGQITVTRRLSRMASARRTSSFRLSRTGGMAVTF